jgi:putative DeoR family transcriptional regulator (stage III sporulation protein D)
MEDYMRDYVAGNINYESINDRVVAEARYIIENNATVRSAGVHFGVSKSTVHKDITDRLYSIDKKLFKSARKVLLKNLAERHIRGGMATKRKYERIKN